MRNLFAPIGWVIGLLVMISIGALLMFLVGLLIYVTVWILQLLF